MEVCVCVCVCGRPLDCDPTLFVSQFSVFSFPRRQSWLYLLLERGTVLTEAHLLEIELAYMSGYNPIAEQSTS